MVLDAISSTSAALVSQRITLSLGMTGSDGEVWSLRSRLPAESVECAVQRVL